MSPELVVVPPEHAKSMKNAPETSGAWPQAATEYSESEVFQHGATDITHVSIEWIPAGNAFCTIPERWIIWGRHNDSVARHPLGFLDEQLRAVFLEMLDDFY
jgi:hypothetical protein